MSWTNEDERAWLDMTKKREANKNDVGKNAFVKALRDLADAVERGEKDAGNVQVEFIRDHTYIGYESEQPVTGRRVTVTINNQGSS